jgi:hypothetical protein
VDGRLDRCLLDPPLGGVRRHGWRGGDDDGGVTGASPAVVLVEGRSDEAAVRALAARLGRDLDAEGVAVEVAGGAGGFVTSLLALPATTTTAAALVDVGEVASVRRGLARSGLEERLELHVCDADLEDGLIRALGTDEVLEVIRAAGEMGLLRSFQAQPAQRERPLDAQLRRFLGTKSGRKIRYGRLLVEAVPLAEVPAPLAGVLSW